MNARLQSIIDNGKKAWAESQAAGRVRITVTLDTSSIARGAEKTIAAIKDVAARKNLDIDLAITGSWGFCWMEPTLTVRTAAGTRTVLYANVTADRVEDFLRRTVVEGGDMPGLALGVVEGNPTAEIALLSDHPFMKGQIRRLMANLGTTDPENIDHYLAHGGYEGFGRALEMDAEAIVKEVVDSGLGGRAGGGFPAGRKWDFLRTATAEPRYLVCNADEGDPGAWVNRVLMEGDPQVIVEGLLIAALAANAQAGYVYIRYEYPLAFDRMQRAVDQAYAKGLLGADILGTGKSFDIVVFKGAGSYVCGEETGLINSIDSYRGMPRIRPPFPAQAGLWNKPTNVNNVESYANAPLIMRKGSAWWSAVSDAKEKGTKMFTFSGAIKQPCCIEIPFGPKVRDVMMQYCGGPSSDRAIKGFQPGGPLSGLVSADDLDFTLTLAPYRERGLFLGGGGIVFFDESACVVDFCRYFLSFAEDESCARCTTCRGGTQRAVEVLRRIQSGGGHDGDIERLEGLVRWMVSSNCFHGQFAMTSVKTSLKAFRAEWIEHIEEKRCRAKVCPGLIEYRVEARGDAALPAAQEICPTGAITGDEDQYRIDDALCIRCGACRELAPRAIVLVDRSSAPVLEGAAAAGA